MISGGPQEQPNSAANGDAWKYFREKCAESNLHNLNPDLVGLAWQWFLVGWRAKARQADVIRGRR
jgi:hypothetical protein